MFMLQEAQRQADHSFDVPLLIVAVSIIYSSDSNVLRSCNFIQKSFKPTASEGSASNNDQFTII